MTRLYLSTQGGTARLRAGRVEVLKDGQVLEAAPLEALDRVVVVGRGVQLTTALVTALLQRDVPVTYVSRGGRYLGATQGAAVAGAELRAAQYSALADPERALGFARGLLGGKLTAQYQHLSGLLAAARPAQRPALTTALARIDAARRDLERAATLDTVRGHEGTAAAAYWRAIVVLVPPAWGFTARRHHPAPDPFNALLSFGYTLLLQEVVTAATIVGLDVGMGALHPADGARPSLALDLEEPFRPLGVDQWVLAAVRHGDLRSHDFVREGERVLLTPAGRRWYLETYGRAMERRVRHPLAPGRVSVRAALELHARLTARVFQGEAERMGAIEWPDSARS